jgi:hypothetical protein
VFILQLDLRLRSGRTGFLLISWFDDRRKCLWCRVAANGLFNLSLDN